jgi:hypothetical protein
MSNTSTFSLKLVKDFTFKEKFNLTHTQTDIMSYLVNLSSWAYTEGSGYYLAVTNKIMMDLDLQTKTVEASILKLKKLKLISVKCMLVKEWSTQVKHRYVAITSKGKTYQSVLYPSKDEKKLNDLEEENRLLKEKIKALEEGKVPKEPKEPKKVKVKPKSEFENITQLRVFVTKKYAKNQEFICNHVKGYLPETAFYINNYNKLALITPDKNCIQIDNLEDSNNFWKFLFENQKSIGKIHKKRAKVDISPLLKFIGEDFTLNDGAICTVKEIIPSKEGVEIYLMQANKGLLRLVPRRINQLYSVKEAMEIFENNPSTSCIST